MEPGKAHIMNDRVDWAAMSDEDLMALLRQVTEAPEGTDSDDD